ncbi:PIN domain-containing protein [Candidatus Saccharibacteria bacterium]|nr:PIN domain-containing protein [Candidatus Saccharibacteria bacterium]
MTLLDANYFLRWFLNDVPSQNKIVKQTLAQAEPDSLMMDRITLAEVTYVLRSLGYNHQQVVMAIKEFYLVASVKPLDKTLSLALDIFEGTSLDFEDCWLAAKVKDADMSLASFDKQLQRFVSSLA